MSGSKSIQLVDIVKRHAANTHFKQKFKVKEK